MNNCGCSKHAPKSRIQVWDLANNKYHGCMQARSGEWQHLLDQCLCKEWEAIIIAFEVQMEGAKHIPGYEQMPGHIIWDIKMDFI